MIQLFEIKYASAKTYVLCDKDLIISCNELERKRYLNISTVSYIRWQLTLFYTYKKCFCVYYTVQTVQFKRLILALFLNCEIVSNHNFCRDLLTWAQKPNLNSQYYETLVQAIFVSKLSKEMVNQAVDGEA